ncbi:hypothetical protein PR048_026587 [Dryococelus australis]|uniref:Uncharacterized protein n=1 Tax=Dryococelus australis TaxID=614101 RepID=A0ABQ9GLR4_9NEOP|nr:hypothetical protein PR048_026587 [Dryococelus australis]
MAKQLTRKTEKEKDANDTDDELSSELNESQYVVVREVERVITSSDDSMDSQIFGDNSDEDKNYISESDVSSSGAYNIEYFSPKKLCTPAKASSGHNKKCRKQLFVVSLLLQKNLEPLQEVQIVLIRNIILQSTDMAGLAEEHTRSGQIEAIDINDFVDSLNGPEDIDVTTQSLKRQQEQKLNRNMGKKYTTAEGKSVPARKSKPLKNCRLGCKTLLEISYGDDGQTYKDHIFREYWGLADLDKRVAYMGMQKYYLPVYLNLTLLYEKYLESTDDPVSRNTYPNEFHQLNISFKELQKDTCYKCGILNTTIKVETDLLKKEALQKQQNLAKNNSLNTTCYMFDLQQYLPTPCLTESVVFYKWQMWTFNLTMYDCANSRTRCYMWHEAEDAHGGNQTATCIYKEFVSLPPDVKHVILYSDTCGEQNKNSHVSVMVLTAMQNNQHLKTVENKFMKRLEIPIYSPQDWYQLVRSTGPKNNKYQVTELNHHDFFEFSSLLKQKKKDNDGNVFSWLQTKWFRYTKEYGQILFKNTLSNDEPFKELSLVRRGAAMPTLELKTILDLDLLPPSGHHFYLGLKSSLKIPDVLPDIEFTNEH